MNLFAGPSLAADAAQPPPSSVAALQSRTSEHLKDGQIPAAGIAVFRDGQPLWLGGVGVADKATGRQADADTHFRIGSISKTFLAIAILQQVEQGKLSLDAKVRDLVPEMPVHNPWEAETPLRVVHLLEHTAGFDDMHFRNMNAIAGQDARTEMHRFGDELQVRWRPGERMSYSNPGYGLLAYILEQVSGQEQRAYISENVLAPLGMTATFWEREPAAATLAQGYQPDTGEPTAWNHTSMPAVGAILSTPRDMARLLQWFLSGGASVPTLLSQESLTRMETTKTTLVSKAGLQAGYGLGNYYSERAGVALRGHSGGIPGYWANLVYNRELGIGYVLLVNVISSKALKPLQQDLIGFALGRTPAPVEAKAVAADPSWNGWYAVSNPRNQITGGFETLINGGWLEAVGEGYELRHGVLPETARFVALPNEQLRDPEVKHANGVLTRDAEGRRVLVTEDNVFVEGSWTSVALPQYGLTAALLLLASSLLFVPIWGIRALRGKLRAVPQWRDRLWPLAAGAVLFATLWQVFQLNIDELIAAQPTLRQLGIAAGSWLFAALGAIGALIVARNIGRHGISLVRMHSLSVSVAAFGLSVWLWRIDLLGIRLWAW